MFTRDTRILARGPHSLKLLALAAIASLLGFTAGCGEPATAPTSSPIEQPPSTRTYSTDPIDTGLLLRDTSAAIQAQLAQGSGVHFSSETFGSAEGGNLYSAGDGDMAGNSQIRMQMTNTVANKVSRVELVTTGGRTYTRPPGGNWQASSTGLLFFDLESMVNELDYARSSRNFGQETLGGGIKTYHVQLDVDSTLAMEEAKKRTTDPAMQVALEGMKGNPLTVDLWIGWDNLLVYQQKTVVSGAINTPDFQSTYFFSKWGEPVNITRPCDAC